MREGVPLKNGILSAPLFTIKPTKSHNSNNIKLEKRAMDMFTIRSYQWKTIGLINIPRFFTVAKI